MNRQNNTCRKAISMNSHVTFMRLLHNNPEMRSLQVGPMVSIEVAISVGQSTPKINERTIANTLRNVRGI